jgi:hypothetical protein
LHRKLWLWLVPVLLLVTALGTKDISIPYWFDEYVTVYNAGGSPYGPLSPAEILQRVRDDDFQTPGHYLLQAGWGVFAGWTEFAGRALTVLCGALAVAWAYRLGSDLVSPLAGLGAAVTMGTSAYFANYMHEMRVYILYALLAAFTVWAYWRVVMRGGRRWPRVGLVLGVAGLLYAHYFASLTVIALGVYHLLFVKKNRLWWQATALMVVGGLLFLPWIGVVVNDVIYAGQNPAKVRPLAMDNTTAFESLLRFFSNGSVALLGLLGAYSLFGKRTRALGLAWFWAIFVTAAALLINARLGVLFSVRHIMGLWPALALIAGIGVDRLSKTGVKPILVLGIWAIAGIWITVDPAQYTTIRQPYAHLHWGQLADALRGRVRADDRVMYLLPYPADSAMHEMVSAYYLYGLPGAYYRIESPRRIGSDRFTADVAQLASGDARLWIGYDASQPPDYLYDVDTVLIKSRVVCSTIVDSDKLHLNIYAPLPNDQTDWLRFGDGISVAPLIPVQKFVTGRSLAPMMGFQLSPDVPPNTYSIGLYVEDAAGNKVAQVDYGVPNSTFGCETRFIDGLPPGSYTLRTSVYRWQDGTRLDGANTQTGEKGDHLTLGSFVMK